jgi:Tfp pilus assembly PilM family ATPase
LAEPRPKTSAEKKSDRSRHRTRGVRRKITRVLALELDAGALYIAEAVRRGRQAQVTRVATVPLPADGSVDSYDPQASGAWIRTALKKADFRSAPVVVCVPRRKVILKLLSLPPGIQESELVSMVHLQLSKDLTFPVDEAIVDFVTHTEGDSSTDTGSHGPRGTKVVVGAVKRELVAFFQSQADAAGIRLHGIGLRSYGNVRYLDYCDVVPSDANAGLICLQGYEVTVDILERGQLAFSRAAAIEPSRLFQEQAGGLVRDTGHVSALTTEVMRTLQSYSHEDRPNEVDHIFIGGSTGLEAELVEQLAERLRLPCERLDPSGAMKLSEPDDVTAARACIGPIGLALAACEAPRLAIDFLRPKEPAKNPNESRLRKVFFVAVGLAAVFCVAAFCHSYVQGKRAGIPFLEQQISKLVKKKKTARRDILRGSLVRGWQQERGEWLDHWAYLSLVLPEKKDIYVSEVRTGAKGRAWVSLRARSGELLSTLEGKLRAAGYELSPLAVTPSKDPFGYDFKTTVEMFVDDDARVETGPGKTMSLREAVDTALAAVLASRPPDPLLPGTKPRDAEGGDSQ